ncbi:hypothetical protein KQH82_05590 [bacterium]|nr:hypothetical protein [bacterium]
MSKDLFEHPFYPIIYVRGYAGSQGEVEETVADPYMGFNIGSTKIRQLWSGEIDRFYFESPLIRLMKDYSYRDVYEGGFEMSKELTLNPRSIIIFRYYDPASKDLGVGRRDEIIDYAKRLGLLIHNLYRKFADRLHNDPSRFRVYLVAHSMGGLICRCFLQNNTLFDQPVVTSESKAVQVDGAGVRAWVDKVFTYATPHNGIDVQLLGNVPGIFSINNSDNFNRKHISNYLNLSYSDTKNVAGLDGKFDPSRFFTLVGTNHDDYRVARGAVSAIIGPMSDGLVKIENATVWGPWVDKNNQRHTIHSPRSFVHRSHSGHYGIVNSESGYQNLARFLFGNIRVDGRLLIDEIMLPPKIQRKKDKEGKTIRASYHFETVVRVRGKLWDLHRRTTAENSAVFRKYDELVQNDNTRKLRPPHLFSIFLSKYGRPDRRLGPMGFSVELGVLVPQYEVDGFLIFDDHYEGGYLYRESLNIEARPPDKKHPDWWLKVGVDSRTPNRAGKPVLASETIVDGVRGETLVFKIPVVQKTRPGIIATLELTASPWNEGETPPSSTDRNSIVTFGGPGAPSVTLTEEDLVTG